MVEREWNGTMCNEGAGSGVSRMAPLQNGHLSRGSPEAWELRDLFLR